MSSIEIRYTAIEIERFLGRSDMLPGIRNYNDVKASRTIAIEY